MSFKSRTALRSAFSIDERAVYTVRRLLAFAVIVQLLRSPRFVSILQSDSLVGFGLDLLPILTLISASALFCGVRPMSAITVTWVFCAISKARAFSSGARIDLAEYTAHLYLFWLMLVPNSPLQGRRAKGVPAPVSPATVGLVIQTVIIYFFAGVSKNHEEWLVEASALHTLFSKPRFATGIASELTAFPDVLSFLSKATVFLEVFGALSLFLPLTSRGTFRYLVVGSFGILHLGMACTLKLGTFPLVSCIVWLLFLPAHFWEACERIVRRAFRSVQPQEIIEGSPSTNSFRSLVARVAVFYVVASSFISFFYFSNYPRIAVIFQNMGKMLGLYQQWFMFSVPSSL